MIFLSMTGSNMMIDKSFVTIWEKFTLTVNEAVQYFNLGEKRLEN